VDLRGIWDFRYDPESRGEAAAWYSSDAAPAWARIQVPGSFDQALRNDVLYQGKAWYRTWFSVAPSSGGRVLLRFDGVAIRSKVWVNGTLAGEHLFPYTGFTLDVTGLVRAGSNRLVVLADNQLLKDAIPDTNCTGWWNYGGINRGVWLETVPEVYAADLAASTKRNPAGGWRRLRRRWPTQAGARCGPVSGRKRWLPVPRSPPVVAPCAALMPGRPNSLRSTS
jgi:beta-glucuronidase